MAGHALAMADTYPEASIIGIEPENASDFRQSLEAGTRIRIDRPASICDGLLSYDVGVPNWPILKQHVQQAISVSDDQTKQAMAWLYQHHGLRTEPSGAIAVAAALTHPTTLEGTGDIVLVLSGRNIDEQQFQTWIASHQAETT